MIIGKIEGGARGAERGAGSERVNVTGVKGELSECFVGSLQERERDFKSFVTMPKRKKNCQKEMVQ